MNAHLRTLNLSSCFVDDKPISNKSICEIPRETLNLKHFPRVMNVLIQDKYINYFTFSSEFNLKNRIFRSFLNDMEQISGMVLSRPSFTDILKPKFEQIEEQLSLPEKYRLILTSDKAKHFSIIELFALLWYASCRNVILYQEKIYQMMAEKRIITMLLDNLKLKIVK